MSQIKDISIYKKIECFDENEKKQIEGFDNEDYKKDFINRLFLKKNILSRHLNIPVNDVRLGKKEFGKPFLINSHYGLDFNVSHTNDFFVCAISDLGNIGIDAEEIVAINLEIAREFCCNNELDDLSVGSNQSKLIKFYKIWTLKEAYLKAIGTGLNFSPKNVCFDVNDLSNIKINNIENNEWSFLTFNISNYMISVCSSYRIDAEGVSFVELKIIDF